MLAVFDSSQALEKEDWELMDALEKVPAIAIVNKSDLPARMDVEAIQKRFEKTVSLSAATGEGLDALEQSLSEILDTKDFHPQEGVLFTQRQRMDAQTALDSLREGEQALVLGLTLDAVTVCVEDALHALAALTGEQVSEEIVDRVFEEFCVGKYKAAPEASKSFLGRLFFKKGAALLKRRSRSKRTRGAAARAQRAIGQAPDGSQKACGDFLLQLFALF